MRVGKKTDYEKITLEISTDGSVAPQEAFSKAVTILVDQFSILLEIEKAETEKDEVAKKEGKIEKEVKKEKVAERENSANIEVTSLKGLSTRTLNVLEKGKISNIEDIVKLTEAQLADLDGMGAKGMKEIKKAIGEFGLNLKQK